MGLETILRREADTVELWTFADSVANTWLAAAVPDLGAQSGPIGNLSLRLDPHATAEDLRKRIAGTSAEDLTLGDRVARGAVDRLKFSEALPDVLAHGIVIRRLRADDDMAELRK